MGRTDAFTRPGRVFAVAPVASSPRESRLNAYATGRSFASLLLETEMGWLDAVGSDSVPSVMQDRPRMREFVCITIEAMNCYGWT